MVFTFVRLVVRVAENNNILYKRLTPTANWVNTCLRFVLCNSALWLNSVFLCGVIFPLMRVFPSVISPYKKSSALFGTFYLSFILFSTFLGLMG